jgi:methylated-DNA-[protein]-cysteine S-methyltransferase
MWFAWSVLRAPVAAPGPVAELTLGVTESGVALVGFGSSASSRRAALTEAARRLGTPPVRDDARVAELSGELGEYLAGRRRRFDYPVDWRLTHGDQQVVLQTLFREVEYGASITYGELAARSGAYRTEHGPGQAARRVGAIMGSNPVPIVVPCHRVLAADGLGGFGGGLESKRWLLGLEGVLPPTLF